jgi:4-amino-4-deoxychorismate lyase
MSTQVSGPLVGFLGQGVVRPDQQTVSVRDFGLSRGDGCFETCRIAPIRDGAAVPTVDQRAEHLARLARSMAALDLPVIDVNDWDVLIDALLTEWGHRGEAALKLVVTRGVEGVAQSITAVATVTAIGAHLLTQRNRGVTAVTLSRGTPSDAFANAPWLLGGVKTLSYAFNMAAGREAVRRGVDDAIYVSTDGFVLEGPTSNILWWSGGVLSTTSIGGTGVLSGTTQGALFAAAERAGLPTTYELIRPADLIAADGVWVISSIRGLAAVRSLDGQPIAYDEEFSRKLGALAGF